jgi:ABC-type multidrug transport system ATPase subunit
MGLPRNCICCNLRKHSVYHYPIVILKSHILEVDSVQKRFGEKSILTDVYLKCETGDIIGLLGGNGSGKSTLLKIIFGIIDADNKFISIDGNVTQHAPQLLRDISFLDHDNFIPQNFSVRKAIALSINKENVPQFHKDEVIHPIIDKKIKHLSGGEKRYLEIMLMLCNDSKFALLDEPYNGLRRSWLPKSMK